MYIQTHCFKARLLLCLLAALTLCFGGLAAAEEASPPYEGTVIGGRLHLRAEPSLESDILATYADGTSLTILENLVDWYRVELPDGATGYMQSLYIWSSEDGLTYEEAVATAQSHEGVVIGGNLHLRSAPSLQADILQTYPEGSTLIFADAGEGWYWVETADGEIGYMESLYIASASATGLAYENRPGIVAQGNLHLRKAPSLDADILATYTAGTDVTVLRAVEGWYQVRTEDGAEGYMEMDFVIVDGRGRIENGGKGVNLRAYADNQAEVLGEFTSGTDLTVLSGSQYWFHVTVQGMEGYMASSFIVPAEPLVTDPQSYTILN